MARALRGALLLLNFVRFEHFSLDVIPKLGGDWMRYILMLRLSGGIVCGLNRRLRLLLG
jgi:hypothetical protein